MIERVYVLTLHDILCSICHYYLYINVYKYVTIIYTLMYIFVYIDIRNTRQ